MLGDIGTPEYPDSTVSVMSSGPDLFILGDVRASIHSDLYEDYDNKDILNQS